MTLRQSTYFTQISSLAAFICVCLYVHVALYSFSICQFEYQASQLKYRIVSSPQILLILPISNHSQFPPALPHGLPGHHESVLHSWNFCFSKCYVNRIIHYVDKLLQLASLLRIISQRLIHVVASIHSHSFIAEVSPWSRVPQFEDSWAVFGLQHLWAKLLLIFMRT